MSYFIKNFLQKIYAKTRKVYFQSIIKYNTVMNTGSLIEELMKSTPLNDMGLPTAIYRPDFLPPTPIGDDVEGANQNAKTAKEATSAISATIKNALLDGYYDCALQTVDYSEGFPSIDGMPLWLRLPFEPKAEYHLFELYLRQYTMGARQLIGVLTEPDCPKNTTIYELQRHFKLYMWQFRVKAHDMFHEVHRRKLQHIRAAECDTDDYAASRKLWDLAYLYLKGNELELMEGMSPKMLLEFMKLASQLKRTSAGVAQTGTQGKNAEGAAQTSSVDVIMKTIAKTDGTIGQGAKAITNSEGDLEAILEDEDAIAMAQELIIRVNTPST